MKKGKKKTLKGSVLFTVVSVMALLIIFLTGTLALASASNNRAHKSYASSQASYTARAAIESFTEAMQREEGIVAAVQALNETNNTLHPGVVFNDGSNSMGIIGYYDDGGAWVRDAISVELINSDNEYAYYDNGDGYGWNKVQLVKVTATCRVGREEETVSAILKKGELGKPKTKRTSSRVKGLNTTGEGTFPNGGRFTGGLGIGLRSDDPGNFSFTNATGIETTLTFINGSVSGSTSTFGIRVLGPTPDGTSPVSQTVVNGNLVINNNKFIQIDYEMDHDFTQSDVPYLYVDGLIYFQSSCDFVVGNNQPYNVFAGAFRSLQSQPIKMQSTDLYLMDSPSDVNAEDYKLNSYDWQGNITSTTRYAYGKSYISGGSSKLHAWTYSVANKTESQFKSTGGNIFCKGDLEIYNSVEIAGDLRVEGDLYLHGSEPIDIKGNVVVGGKLTIGNDANNLRIGGTVYCNDISDSRNNNRLENPTGSLYGDVQPGYREVNNIYHPAGAVMPTNFKILNTMEREYFRWEPSVHSNLDGEQVNIDGSVYVPEEQDPVVYYRYKEAYATNMTQYRNVETGEFKYVYRGQETEYPDSDEYVFSGNVDDLLFTAQEGYVVGNPDSANIQNAIETFIDFESSISQAQYDENSTYKVRQDVFWYGDDKYVIIDASIPTEYDELYYDLDNRTVITELGEIKPAHYTIADINGNDTGIETTEEKSYYRESDGERVSKEVATRIGGSSSGSGTAYYQDFGQNAYPPKMERSAIYGYYDENGQFRPGGPDTKIVKTLQEVREDMSIDPDTNSYDKNVYLTELPDGVNADADPFKKSPYWDGYETENRDGGQFRIHDEESGVWIGDSIAKSCTITGTLTKEVIRIKPAAAGDTDEVWIVLKNLTLDGSEIIVDTGDMAGVALNFLIDGTLEMKRSAITHKDIYDGCTIDYTFNSGITFYGRPNSAIKLSEQSTLVGNFKCPETTFSARLPGIYVVNYTDEYGVDWSKKNRGGQGPEDDLTKGKPAIVGNALFKDVLDSANEFGIYYTESGEGGGDDGITGGDNFQAADGGYWEVSYFTGT